MYESFMTWGAGSREEEKGAVEPACVMGEDFNSEGEAMETEGLADQTVGSTVLQTRQQEIRGRCQ